MGWRLPGCFLLSIHPFLSHSAALMQTLLCPQPPTKTSCQLSLLPQFSPQLLSLPLSCVLCLPAPFSRARTDMKLVLHRLTGQKTLPTHEHPSTILSLCYFKAPSAQSLCSAAAQNHIPAVPSALVPWLCLHAPLHPVQSIFLHLLEPKEGQRPLLMALTSLSAGLCLRPGLLTATAPNLTTRVLIWD